MKYRVVETNSRFELESAVELKIKEGWTPQGGVSAFKDGWSTYYQQAMVKS